MSDDDQHDRALGIARNKRETGDLQGALRFAKKAAGMRESKEATFLIGAIEKVRRDHPVAGAGKGKQEGQEGEPGLASAGNLVRLLTEDVSTI
jgi:hypothetical protein